MLLIRAFRLCVCVALFVGYAHSETFNSEPSQSINIPSSGDSCNVVNLNFAGGSGSGGSGEAKVGPKGEQGPQGPEGIKGPKGEKGAAGEVGPRGPEPSISKVASAVLRAMGSTSCVELMEVHGIADTGYYLMRSEEKEDPVYKYCDFEDREGVHTCYQLREKLGNEMRYGYYLLKDAGTSDSNIVYCGREEFPKDCSDVNRSEAKHLDATGGVFDIYHKELEASLEVYCDLETDDGGWTVFQRRLDGSINFTRGWNDYVNGFGSTAGELWLGLENLHRLTKFGSYDLRVDMKDWYGLTKYAKYENFSIASAEDEYKLNIPYVHTGNVGNSLFDNIGRSFSTTDVDNDGADRNHCAENTGGWWYDWLCGFSNLNAEYPKGPGEDKDTILWWGWSNGYHNLKFTEMKFRRSDS